jgi:predicted O-methyltransferase YrrM
MIDQATPPTHFEEVVPVKRCTGSIEADVLHYMSELHGWCAPGKAKLLVDLVLKTKPNIILEIGVWGGKSLIPMAYALRENGRGIAYGIDPWESHESVQWVKDETNKHFGNLLTTTGCFNI